MKTVLADYQQEFDKSKSKGKREQISRAIARSHEQLKWLEKKLPTEKKQENYEKITSMIPSNDVEVGAGERVEAEASSASKPRAEENNTKIPAMDNTTTAAVKAVKKSVEYLSLSEISTDGGTQSRLKLNDPTVKDYAEAMAEE